MAGSLLVRGGTVVTAEGTWRADVLVREGVVAAVGNGVAWDAQEVLDATGLHVLPGGVDTHTHFEHLSATGGTRTADDFRSGTEAAALGGTTTVVDFSRRQPGESVTAAFARRLEQAEAGAVVDYGFHPIVPAAAAEDGSFDELVEITERYGATSWKFFMAYPGQMASDDVLIRGFRLARDLGVLPMAHAENGHMIADAVAGLLARGETAEHRHAESHPALAEREAINRAAEIAEWVGTPLFVVHVSSTHGAREIARLRSGGRPVMGETCPQYLLTGYEDYAGLGFEAAKYVCSPPIRERAHQEGLWRALADGTLGSVGTDHAAFAMTQPADLPPQKPQGRGHFPDIPNGVPGVQERLMLLHHFGVGAGRMSLERFVEVTAAAPARTFGLHPRKGTIAPGADADLVLWDREREVTLRAKDMRTRAGYTLYEGMTVRGAPRHVLSRGETVVRDGALTVAGPRGEYLPRAPYQAS